MSGSRGTLEDVQMSRSVSELCCIPLHAVSAKFVQKQIRFSDRQAEKHSFMFDEGTSTPNLDCPWYSVPVCVPWQMAGWHFGAAGSRQHTRLLLGTSGSHPALFRGIVSCIVSVACADFAPQFAPGPTCRPSDLMTRFGVLSAYRGFSVSFVQPLSRPTSSDPGEMVFFV